MELSNCLLDESLAFEYPKDVLLAEGCEASVSKEKVFEIGWDEIVCQALHNAVQEFD
jgi:hypothetical protein